LKTMGLTLQPCVIVISEDINNVDTVDGSIPYAIRQSNLYYKLLIIVAAVDVCIKACFVMDLSYAVGAVIMGLHQQGLYDIHTRHDYAGSKVLQLLADSAVT